MKNVQTNEVSVLSDSSKNINTNFGVINTEEKTFAPDNPRYTYTVEGISRYNNVTDLRNVTQGYLVNEQIIGLLFLDANSDLFKSKENTVICLREGKSLLPEDYKFLAIDRHSKEGRKLIRETNARFQAIAVLIEVGADPEMFYEKRDPSSDNFYLTKAVGEFYTYGSSEKEVFAKRFKKDYKNIAKNAAKLYLMSNLIRFATHELTINKKGITHATEL